MSPQDLDRTHPFLCFNFDASSIGSRTWMLLGEAMSKCQHLAGVPLKPQAAMNLSSVYLARGVQATTAIEGNTLSDQEVKDVVEKGTANVGESRSYLELEVQNVLAQIREIDDALRNGHKLAITSERLRKMNFGVLTGIPDKPEVVPGEFREHDVSAGTYRAPHWAHVPDLTDQFVRWLAELRGQVTSASRREDRFFTAVIGAVLAHLYVAWIHPFGNGNGRTARLIEVQILSESGVVPLVATNLLSDHYNKTRDAYYRALDAAQHDVAQFVQYAVLGFAEELRAQIDVVRNENKQVHWESYVHEVFNDFPHTDARARQKAVALALAKDQVVTPEQVTVLTPKIARDYALAGPRIPVRDLNDLSKMDLVEKLPRRRYRANREIIEAFIPPVSDVE